MIPTFVGFQKAVLKPSAPIMTYFSTGVFSISNYSPSLVYVATLTTGSGNATLNTSTGRYTLSGPDSRFRIVAKYGVGAPESDADFIERNSYSYSCRNVQNCVSCCCSATCNGYCTSGEPCPPGVGQGFEECGCLTFFCGTITVTCGQSCTTSQVCDVFIDESSGGYINSGTEWYKVS